MTLARWEAYCERLKAAGRVTEASWLDDDPLNVAEIHKQLVMNLGLGYMLCVATDPQYPDFIPFLNNSMLFLFVESPS